MLSEPTTLASDWLLAAASLAFAARLRRHGAGKDGPALRLWTAGFRTGAVAAIAGGSVHGFAASLSPAAHDVLWATTLFAIGIAGSCILAGTVLSTLTGAWRAAALAAAGLQLAAYLGVVAASHDIRHAVWNGAVTIAAILALALVGAVHDSRRLGWIVLALVLSAVALAVQRAGLSAAPMNHNDLCHLLQSAALWPFYRAGLRLHPTAPSPVQAKGHSMARASPLA